MNIRAHNGVLVADATFAEKDIVKGAGFWWHGGGCKDSCQACKAGLPLKVWWTPKNACAARLIDACDASAKALLSGHIETVEASKAVDADVVIPKPDGLDYLPYQRGGIAYAMGRPSTLIGDEMGLGKTIQALGVINATPDAKNVLCIVPASLRLNWKKEAEKWLVKSWNYYVVETKLPIPADANFIIINYDRLGGTRNAEIFGQLMSRAWDILIVDEAHYVKNAKALRTKAVIGHPGNKKEKVDPVEGLTSRATRQLFLTGTPILNRPVELHPLLASLAPAEFGNFFTFAKRYCAAYKGAYGWDFSGASNLEELQERLRATVMVRRLKRDVLKELPAKRRQVIILPTNGAAKMVKAEQAALESRKEALEAMRLEADYAHASGDKEAYEAAIDGLKEVMAVAFSEMSEVRREVALAKVPKVIEHLENAFASGVEKIVCFGHHRDVCNAIVEHFGASAVRLTGEDTSITARQASVDRFQTDPTCTLFVGSIKAAGVGHTLTAASTVIFAELDWTPANLTQAEDRCHRIGQLESVNVQHLVLDGSIDAHMAQMCIDKQEVADAALDGFTGIEVPAPVAPTGPRRPAKYPACTEEARTAAHTAMRILAGVCDGAAAKDDQGFNRLDTSIGHKLAHLEVLSDGQAWLAINLARKYQKQLPSSIKDVLGFGCAA